MIFKNADLVLSGRKTQTCRLVRPSDETQWADSNIGKFASRTMGYDWFVYWVTRNGRSLYRLGSTCAVQAGRGKPALGRIKLRLIEQRRIQSLTSEELIAEGVSSTLREHAAGVHLQEQFVELWDSIHKPLGERWAADPKVWLLRFVLVELDGRWLPS